MPHKTTPFLLNVLIEHICCKELTIQIKDKHDQLNTYLVEIKPKVQCSPPKFPGRRTKRYLAESKAYIINSAKWKAAEQYALDRGQKFIIINEDDLGLTWKTGIEKPK